MATGRFAPSPTGPLHLGNLRTALLAWLAARSAGSAFRMRVDDLDAATARADHEAGQLADLRAIGVDWDGPLVRQSERRGAHDEAIAELERAGLTYPCWCSRREIREAAAAPHDDPSAPELPYPGTCRDLSSAERAERERAAGGRPPSLRLRAGGEVVEVVDRLHGPVSGVVDDIVLRRYDGTPAYNLAVVVDDAAQGVQEVVRADDLLSSTPRQVLVARLLGLTVPAYAHVPLVLAPDGSRLAKRHGAVTLADRLARGETVAFVVGHLAASAGLGEPGAEATASDLLSGFSLKRVPRAPWVLDPADVA